MPNINSLAEVMAQPEWPYHYHYDNLPLKQILLRQDMINAAVDANSQILENAKGTAGDLAARLNKSLLPDGSLKGVAIPTHSIDLVLDSGAVSVDTSQTYVKMTTLERAKLAGVSSNATALEMRFGATPVDVIFRNESVKFSNSSTITWLISSDSTHTNNSVTAHLATPVPQVQVYGVTPNTTDYRNYSIGQAVVPNSLRVFVNGIRLTSDTTVCVPNRFISSCTTACWDNFSYVPIDSAGTFQLNAPLTSTHVVRVDYNRTS